MDIKLYKNPLLDLATICVDVLVVALCYYILPRLNLKNTFKYIRAVNEFFKKHKEYDIVHGHLTSVGFIYLTFAKIHNIKTRIIHAHATSVEHTFKGFVERIIMFPLRFCADYYFACSNEAGKYIYGKRVLKKQNYRLIRNGVMVDQFVFNSDLRSKKRAELGLNDKFTIGNIGRFENQKNHGFIIDIFYEVYKRNKYAVLMLIGAGSLKEDIIRKVHSLNIDDAVLFLDARSDINELMQAMDIFLLPSHYEGLPVVGIEAQASGLQCFFSDVITRETDITGMCNFISLNMSANFWAEEILKFQKDYERRNMKEAIIKAGYDIREQTKQLEAFYLKNKCL